MAGFGMQVPLRSPAPELRICQSQCLVLVSMTIMSTWSIVRRERDEESRFHTAAQTWKRDGISDHNLAVGNARIRSRL